MDMMTKLLMAIDENIDIRPELSPEVDILITSGLTERVEVLQLTETGEAILAKSRIGA